MWKIREKKKTFGDGVNQPVGNFRDAAFLSYDLVSLPLYMVGQTRRLLAAT